MFLTLVKRGSKKKKRNIINYDNKNENEFRCQLYFGITIIDNIRYVNFTFEWQL